MKTLVLLTFILYISFSFAKEESLSYVYGRSGDILLKQKDFVDKSTVFILNRYSNELNEIEDISFADLVSHNLGGPVINAESSRNGFPKGSVFDKSSSNLLIVVDSLDSEYLSKFTDLKLFNLKHPATSTPIKQLKLVRSSYPEDTIATLATLISGNKPSDHGITGSSWATSNGQIVAYRADALPLIQNLADQFSSLFNGRSLVLSASSDFQAASALGVNQFEHYPLSNDVTLYYEPTTRSFQSAYHNGIDVSSLKLTVRQIVDALTVSPLVMPGVDDVMTVTDSGISIDMKSKNLKADFAIHNNDVFLFFAELQFLRNLLNGLQSEPSLSAMTVDRIPDLLSFSFASLKEFQSKYNRNTAQFQIAVYLLDEMINTIITTLSTIYDNKLSTEVVFLGNSSVDSIRSDIKQINYVYNNIKKYVNKDVYDNNFPQIYLKDINQQAEVCELLRAATTYEVICPEIETSSFNYYGHELTQTNNVTGTKDAAIYQICLWFSILLIIVAFAVVISLCTMDVGADSMLYRSTNIRHQHVQ